MQCSGCSTFTLTSDECVKHSDGILGRALESFYLGSDSPCNLHGLSLDSWRAEEAGGRGLVPHGRAGLTSWMGLWRLRVELA